MIEDVRLQVMNDNVLVFGGEIALPRGIYSGAIESYVIRPDGVEQSIPVSALIRVNRAVLKGLGATIAPNLAAVDFGVLSHLERGDIQVRRCAYPAG